MAKNWTVKSYTNDTWTKLVGDVAELSAIIMANTDAENAITGSIRLASASGEERAVLMPPKSISAGGSNTFEIPGLKVGPGDVIEVKGSAAGLHFIASGDEIS